MTNKDTPRHDPRETIDRIAAVTMQHHRLLLAMFSKMPNPQEVLAQYEAISGESLEELRAAKIPEDHLRLQEESRDTLLAHLRDELERLSR
jgi:rubrerythrin